MYPIEKYRYYTTKTVEGGHKVIAVSTYAGKTVRGVAICHPQDTFDLEIGKKIAAARCALKIAEKRLDRADRKQGEAYASWRAAERYLDKMSDYANDAEIQLYEAQDYLEDLLADL